MRAAVLTLAIAGAAGGAVGGAVGFSRPALAEDTPIRVAILHHQFQTVISSEGGLTVRPPDAKAGSPYVSPEITTVLDVRPRGGGFLLAGVIQTGGTLVVAPTGDYPLAVDGHRYRGSAILQANSDGTLDVINVVDLEEYLYGVVGSEMDPGWPSAALQAQAIVARTFAVAHLATREWLGYDLFAGERDQAYKGMQAESPTVVAAVDATHGIVLVYDSNLVHAYYSSCDGGYTSDGLALEDPQPYLQAASDRYCSLSPDDLWTVSISLDDFAAAFRSRYGDVGKIKSIDLGSVDASGRLKTVIVRGESAQRAIPATVFRSIAGNHAVRSTRIASIDVADGAIKVAGAGFGHGVGMAQWGARRRAQAGMSASEILRFYYPGAQIARIAGR